MHRALALIVGATIASGGCGDNLAARGATPEQLLARLRSLPGVTVDEAPTSQVGYSYYILHVTQPVDHEDPSLGTFQQEVSLLHASELAPVPMIVLTSGYADYYGDKPHELTTLLGANQVSIEHRYFGSSRPAPADWTKLTIAQAAADEHAIIAALRTIYEGAFITTGGSKGGMTAMFHRRFYPDDVEATVPYVAPISFGAPDRRYRTFLDTVGRIDCRQAVRDAATEMLSNRRDAMRMRAAWQPGHTYTRVALDPAVEAAIVSLEWTYWQYFGSEQCSSVPPVTASDDVLFGFLDRVSPVADSSDAKLAQFEAYYYQAHAELGYPDGGAEYLAPFLRFTDEDYDMELPTAEPVYDSGAMRDIDDFVEHRGSHLLFIYGEWDPWTAGRFSLGDASDAVMLVQPQGTHGSRIAGLAMSDRDVALARLQAWTGVPPMLSRLHVVVSEVAPAGPRVPPAMVRALRARK